MRAPAGGGKPLPYIPLPLFKDREELLTIPRSPRALGGDQVAEQLAYDRQAIRSDPFDGRLGVSGQRSAHSTDVVVRLAGEESAVAIPLLPQPGRSKCEHRERSPFLFHNRKDLVDQLYRDVIAERPSYRARR